MILVTDAIIHTKKKYIIVISGLDNDIVNNVCLEMAGILKYTYLSFLDIPISDDQKYYNNILYRIEYLLNIRPQGIIISLLSFPNKYNMFDAKLHINLSINQTYFDNIKKKFDYSNDLLIEYNNVLKSNKVNKYINTKLDSDFNQIKKQVFDTIITSIEKTYYGTNYDTILQNRNNDNSNNDTKNNNSSEDSNNNNTLNNKKSNINSSNNSESNSEDSDNKKLNNKRVNNKSSDNSESNSEDSDNSNSEDSESDDSDNEESDNKKLNNKRVNKRSFIFDSDDLNAYSSNTKSNDFNYSLSSISLNQDVDFDSVSDIYYK
jgi:hypothetical protein